MEKEFPSLEEELSVELPDVPILPETLLFLDLKVQEACVDLDEMSQLVLGDLGATLQILRLAGRDCESAEDRPRRIEDCIASMGLQACLDAAAAKTIARDRRNDAIAEVWGHSRRIAEFSREAAEEMGDLHPEEAYLVGLFHMIGSLPALLDWEWRVPGVSDSAFLGLMLAKAWGLPPCVVELFCEMCMGDWTGKWSQILQAAHRKAKWQPIECSFQQYALTQRRGRMSDLDCYLSQ